MFTTHQIVLQSGDARFNSGKGEKLNNSQAWLLLISSPFPEYNTTAHPVKWKGDEYQFVDVWSEPPVGPLFLRLQCGTTCIISNECLAVASGLFMPSSSSSSSHSPSPIVSYVMWRLAACCQPPVSDASPLYPTNGGVNWCLERKGKKVRFILVVGNLRNSG